MSLNRRRLSAFIALARNLNFTQTAKEISLAQSSLSDLIQALETELGVTLFNRARRGISLTPAGELFRQYAEEIIALSDEAKMAVRVAAGASPAELTIGALETIASTTLAKWLADFQAGNPDIRVRLRVGGSGDLRRALLAGETDIVFLFDNGSRAQQLHGRTVARVPMVLVGPRDRVPEQGDAWGIAALRSEKFVVTERGCVYRHLFDSAFDEVGVAAPEVVSEVGSIGTIVHMVASGAGLALVPRLAAADALEKGGLIEWPWPGRPPSAQLQMQWRRRRVQPPALQSLLAHVSQSASPAIPGDDRHPHAEPFPS